MMKPIMLMFDEQTALDMCYVTGQRHYDDDTPDPHAVPQTRKHIDRVKAHTLKYSMEGYSDPIESFLNPDR